MWGKMLHLVKSRQKIGFGQSTTSFSPHSLIFWVQVKLSHKSIFGFVLRAGWWLSQIASEWPPFMLCYSITTRDAWWIRDWIQYNVFTVLQQTRAIVSVPESMWAQAWPVTSVWAKRVWPLHHRQWGTHKIHFQTLVGECTNKKSLLCAKLRPQVYHVNTDNGLQVLHSQPHTVQMHGV